MFLKPTKTEEAMQQLTGIAVKEASRNTKWEQCNKAKMAIWNGYFLQLMLKSHNEDLNKWL